MRSGLRPPVPSLKPVNLQNQSMLSQLRVDLMKMSSRGVVVHDLLVMLKYKAESDGLGYLVIK
jgi:hypothetical protein